MIIVDWQIEEAVNGGEIGISDFSPERLQPASYDMRVGDEAYTTALGRVIKLDVEGPLHIQPGDFAVILTHEKLRLPLNYIGRFGLRSYYARLGLLATVGPQVDPGFEGKLAVGMVNFNSVELTLEHLAPFCTLELHRIENKARKAYEGPYQNQDHLSEDMTSRLRSEALPLAMMLVRQLAAAQPAISDQLAHTGLPARSAEPSALAVDPAFLREREAFNRLKPDLLREYRGKWVAVHQGKVIVIGNSSRQVATEAYAKVGYVPLYVGLVEERPPVMHIPSPRRGKKATE